MWGGGAVPNGDRFSAPIREKCSKKYKKITVSLFSMANLFKHVSVAK